MEIATVKINGEIIVALKTSATKGKPLCRLSDIPRILEENRHLKLENEILNAKINKIHEEI